MPIDAHIQDPVDRHRLKVNREGTAGVVVHDHPPVGDVVQIPLWHADLETAAGSGDMVVTGTLAAPVDFIVSALPTADRWVRSLSLEVSDRACKLYLFGALAALTNGVQILHITQDLGEVELSLFKTNWQMLMQMQSGPRFGAGATAGIALDAVANQEDTIPAELDLRIKFGPQWGLRLRRGTNDRVVVRIRDDMTGLVAMTGQAFGAER
jgi:hypothetical protein